MLLSAYYVIAAVAERGGNNFVSSWEVLSADSKSFNKAKEKLKFFESVMILASPGQHSCNTRTHIPTTFGQAFLYYPDIHS